MTEGQQPVLERAKAIETGSTTYFTGRPCKNGHTARRYVIGCGCVQCAAEATERHNAAIRARRQAIKAGAPT